MSSKLKLVEEMRAREEPVGVGRSVLMFAGLLAALLGASLMLWSPIIALIWYLL